MTARVQISNTNCEKYLFYSPLTKIPTIFVVGIFIAQQLNGDQEMLLLITHPRDFR